MIRALSESPLSRRGVSHYQMPQTFKEHSRPSFLRRTVKCGDADQLFKQIGSAPERLGHRDRPCYNCRLICEKKCQPDGTSKGTCPPPPSRTGSSDCM